MQVVFYGTAPPSEAFNLSQHHFSLPQAVAYLAHLTPALFSSPQVHGRLFGQDHSFSTNRPSDRVGRLGIIATLDHVIDLTVQGVADLEDRFQCDGFVVGELMEGAS